MENRVVITGMGIYSCLGNNLEEVKKSLFEGKSGIVFDQKRKDLGYKSPLTGNVEDPDLKKFLTRRQRKSMGQPAQYAYMATREAVENAGLDIDYFDKNPTGIIFGNDSTAQAIIEGVDKMREKKDTQLIGSGSIFQSMNCTVNMNLSTIFKLKGMNLTISAACASGSHSIGLGHLLIKQGLQDRVICGGAQEVNEYAMGSFDALGAFSDRIDDPTKACRPFDSERDGLVPSGGAAALILESYDSAIKRGAPILAEIIGYGFSSNGEHISNPNLQGQISSLNMVLEQAKIDPSEIDYINAHATSTPVGDKFEAMAIHEIFGGEVPVSSTKSMTGHECWMAGASEVVYSMLMMQNDFVAPNINYEKGDDETSKINIVNKTKQHTINTFLSNSFGFGGTNSSLIIKKFKKWH